MSNDTRSLAENVMRRLETHLLDGSWQPGMRLPPERTLAEEYGVSRATVREATQRLVARGLLASKRGSGVFVTDRLQSGFISPWRQLVADHPELRSDMLEFRRVLEGSTAYFAAMRADKADLKRMGEVIRRLQQASESGDHALEVKTDAEFHEAIADASHNVMFRHLHASVIKMLREHIALNIAGLQDQQPVSPLLLQQHLAIWEGIRQRQPEAARQAMLAHIDFVRHQLEPDVPGVG